MKTTLATVFSKLHNVFNMFILAHNVHVCVLWHAGVLKVMSHTDNYLGVFDDEKCLFEVELRSVSLEMLSVREE